MNFNNDFNFPEFNEGVAIVALLLLGTWPALNLSTRGIVMEIWIKFSISVFKIIEIELI